MRTFQITYKGESYIGKFKIKRNFVTAYYKGKSKGTHTIGNPENIKAQKRLAQQLLEDLIRSPTELPSYMRKSLWKL